MNVQLRNQLEGCNPVTPSTLTKTVAASGTPEALASSKTEFRHATIIAKKGARSANTGTVYLGTSSANDSQPIPLAAGDEYVLSAGPGMKMDFQDWYLDVATNGDGVVVIYW